MNCTKCKTKAVIGLPRHNAAFCKGCFNGFVHDQVARAIKSEKLIAREDRVLVAVSGGKDGLALWDILLKLGYRADALYVDLGIGAYSEQSHAKVTKLAEAVAAPQGAVLHLHTVEQEAGAGIKGTGPTHPSPDLLDMWDNQTLPIQSRGDRTAL